MWIINLPRRRLVAVTAIVLACVTGVAGASQAWAGGDRSPGTSGAQIEALQDCDGGVQKASLVRTQNSPTTITELPIAVPLPNSLRTFDIDQGDIDQVRITFMAEAVLLGSVFDASIPIDGLSLEIRLDGVPLPNSSDLAFTSGTFGANAAMVCRRVGEGRHTVEIYWQLIDSENNNTLTGRLDDWALDIQINT